MKPPLAGKAQACVGAEGWRWGGLSRGAELLPPSRSIDQHWEHPETTGIAQLFCGHGVIQGKVSGTGERSGNTSEGWAGGALER